VEQAAEKLNNVLNLKNLKLCCSTTQAETRQGTQHLDKIKTFYFMHQHEKVRKFQKAKNRFK
jgi:thermostable 8-oxoguanine DNA glycosylase